MRLLHIGVGNLFGGIETLLVTLAKSRLFCPEMEPHFAVFFRERLSNELAVTGVPVHHVGEARYSRPWTIWSVRRQLAQLLRTIQPDVVVTHGCWQHPIVSPVVGSAGLPLVFWAHNILTGNNLIERWASRHLPCLVVANSKATAASIPLVFRDTPTEIVHYPGPTQGLYAGKSERTEIRARWNVADDTVVLLMVSRMEEWKGHRLLLAALAQLASVPNWSCWIAGGPQRREEEVYRQELVRLVEKHQLANRVRFLGQRSDVPALLAAADLFCQPNTGLEAFGVVFIEALAAGVPIITTAMGGPMEIVDPSCGRLVPPNAPTALAEQLRELILNPELRANLSRHCPQRAKELCDPEQQLLRLEKVLTATLKNPTQELACTSNS